MVDYQSIKIIDNFFQKEAREKKLQKKKTEYDGRSGRKKKEQKNKKSKVR
ncbi:hypothetical protein ES708_13249 [subsurface metagenome]